MAAAAQGARLYVWGAVLAAGVAGLGGSMWAIGSSIGDPVTRHETREVPQALLSTSSSAADAAARFDGPPAQSIPATQIGLQSGTCDVWPLADGGVLICHA